MQAAVSSLILLTSVVIFSSVVVGFAVEIFASTLTYSNQQLSQLQTLNQNILNQTRLFANGTSIANQTAWLSFDGLLVP